MTEHLTFFVFGIIVGVMATWIVPARAMDCSPSPDRIPGLTWRYRVVDGQRCWYRSRAVLAKSELTWRITNNPSAGAEPETLLQPDAVETVGRTAGSIPATGATTELTMPFDGPLKPKVVKTITYEPMVEQPRLPVGYWVARIAVLAGGLSVLLCLGGLLWPLRRRAEYDGQKDLGGSIKEGFAAIRARVAAGGPGWQRKEG